MWRNYCGRLNASRRGQPVDKQAAGRLRFTEEEDDMVLVRVKLKDKDLLSWRLEISFQLLLLYYGKETRNIQMFIVASFHTHGQFDLQTSRLA